MDPAPAAEQPAMPAALEGKAFYGSFLPERKKRNSTDKAKHLSTEKPHLPLVYSTEYNISFLGLEKLHPFDSCKYENVMKFLVDTHKLFKEDDITKPIRVPTDTELLTVHTKHYLESLNSSYTVAQITELSFIAMMPSFLARSRVLTPMLHATSGTIVSGMLAVQNGWSINVGGGFHHCSASEGGGFCPYADITLCYHFLRKHCPGVKRVMIIDLDAHQGNGHEHDKIRFKDQELVILDVFNPRIYPGDKPAKEAIDIYGPVPSGTDAAGYLKVLNKCLADAQDYPKPDFIIYNAGTDVLAGDPLGCLEVSAEGVIERDETVFRWARSRNIPITMVLSGGYQRSNAEVIANSLNNMHHKGLIKLSVPKNSNM